MEVTRVNSGNNMIPSSIATHLVNIRERMDPPLLRYSLGNLWRLYIAAYLDEKKELELQELDKHTLTLPSKFNIQDRWVWLDKHTPTLPSKFNMHKCTFEIQYNGSICTSPHLHFSAETPKKPEMKLSALHQTYLNRRCNNFRGRWTCIGSWL